MIHNIHEPTPGVAPRVLFFLANGTVTLGNAVTKGMSIHSKSIGNLDWKPWVETGNHVTASSATENDLFLFKTKLLGINQ